MKKIILKIIKLYQHYISLDTGVIKKYAPVVKICRFSPTCSEYTYHAIDKYGIIHGLWIGLCRIIRCNPLTKGGFDPLK